MDDYGVLIHRERLLRNWSQEGLCKGICAVSYLSKIEQGKAAPSDAVLRLLLERLEISTELDAEARELCNRAYEALFSGDFEALDELLADVERHFRTGAGLDLMLLQRLNQPGAEPLDVSLEACMDTRTLALQRVLQGRYPEAIALCPNAYFYYVAGVEAYESGENYPKAVEYLQTAYDLAAKEGRPYLMLDTRLFMGNCYANQIDLANMERHFQIAERLARALRHDVSLEHIRYNRAATQIEAGKYADAYAYFSTLSDPGALSLHKLAVCCEKLGKREQALAALDKAQEMPAEAPLGDLYEKMCALVRYRLEHPDYLTHAEYGKQLLTTFDALRRNQPIGYAGFHLPWVLEWYQANRQYKAAFALLANFPVKVPFQLI